MNVCLFCAIDADEWISGVEDAMWSTLPLAELAALRTFVLELDVLDWEPEESNTMQDTALTCLKIISPTITKLQLQFYLIDIGLASVCCLLSDSRWMTLDRIVSQLPKLETFQIVLNVKVFLGVDEYVSQDVEHGVRAKFLQRLHLTVGQYMHMIQLCTMCSNCIFIASSCEIILTLNLPVADYSAPELVMTD